MLVSVRMPPSSDVQGPPTPAAPAKKPKLSERLNQLVNEYGAIALSTYLGIFVLVFAAFALAITRGLYVPEGGMATTATLGAAWLATKATQPIRIGVTLVLTPIVAGFLQRFRKTTPPG